MAADGSTHEDLRRAHDVAGSSDRSFGFVFAGFFAILGALPLIGGGEPIIWLWALAAAFAAVAILFPKTLASANRLWMKFGLLLGRIVNPVVMGIVFFIAVTPTGLMMRALGKDPLRLKFDKETDSYWIDRTPPAPAPDSMKRQF